MNSALIELPYIGIVTFQHLFIIFQLIILEGLLSFDNALALAALVKGKLSDPGEQKRALRWGIAGAYAFRTLVIFIGVWLMEHEWIKFVAGAYLIWLAISELWLHKPIDTDHPENSTQFSLFSKFLPPLWATILQVELVDIMFSIDSIGVALAFTNEKWVLIAGAIFGILMMRFAAGQFITLIDKFPVLEKTAFILVGIAGLNVVLKTKELPLGFTSLTIDKPIPEHIFLPLLLIILIGSMMLNKLYPHKFR